MDASRPGPPGVAKKRFPPPPGISKPISEENVNFSGETISLIAPSAALSATTSPPSTSTNLKNVPVPRRPAPPRPLTSSANESNDNSASVQDVVVVKTTRDQAREVDEGRAISERDLTGSPVLEANVASLGVSPTAPLIAVEGGKNSQTSAGGEQTVVVLPRGEKYVKPSWPPPKSSNESERQAPPPFSRSPQQARVPSAPPLGPPPPRPPRLPQQEQQQTGAATTTAKSAIKTFPPSSTRAMLNNALADKVESSTTTTYNPFDDFVPSVSDEKLCVPYSVKSDSNSGSGDKLVVLRAINKPDVNDDSGENALPPRPIKPAREAIASTKTVTLNDADFAVLGSPSGHVRTISNGSAAPPPPPPPKRSISNDHPMKLVLYDFDGSQMPRGLTVRAGDKVNVISVDGAWCVASYGKRSGLVPLSYLSDLPLINIEQAQLAANRIPPRPSRFDQGKENGFARDMIGIISRSRAFGPVTKPVVRFYGQSAKREHIGERVQVFVDGRPVYELRLGEGGMLVDTNPESPFEWDLRTLAPQALQKDSQIHALHVRFEHVLGTSSTPIRFVECTLFIWSFDDVVVVSDVDGTITLSDVGGHLNTTLLIKAGYSPNTYAHPGVCALFTHLARECYPCRFVYLTARPLDLCVETRTYLRGLKQEGKTLPLGPCVTDSTTYYGSLRREVLDKSSHLFKAEFLEKELKGCFERAGRDVVERPIYMVGFGNKDTDAAAYRMAGLDARLTFIIDSRSVLTAGAGYAAELSSYDDPNLLDWLSKTTRQFRNGTLPDPIN